MTEREYRQLLNRKFPQPESRPAKEVSPGLFEHHNCSRCRNGEKPCIDRVPGNCGNPIAKNH